MRADASPSYSILLEARGDAPDFRLTDDPGDLIHYTEEEQARIASAVAAASATGRVVRDEPLYRFRACGFDEDGTPFIRLGRTGYAAYVGTHHAAAADAFPHGRLARPIAVTGVTFTSDGYVLAARRSARVFAYPHHYDARPSGHPHPPDSLREAVLKELHEETGVTRNEVEDTRVLGIIENTELAKPEAVYAIRVALTGEDVLARAADAEDAWEGDVMIVPARIAAVDALLDAGPWSPTGRGAFALAARAGLFHDE